MYNVYHWQQLRMDTNVNIQLYLNYDSDIFIVIQMTSLTYECRFQNAKFNIVLHTNEFIFISLFYLFTHFYFFLIY